MSAPPAADSLEVVRALVRRHGRWLAAVSLGLGVLVVVAGLVPRREWEVESSFLPQSRRPSGNLSQLAAQFGVVAPSADGQQTPQFFADLITSRELLHRVAIRPLDVPGGRLALDTLLGVTLEDSARREDEVVRRLGLRVETEVSPKTGVVTVRVRLPHAAGAHALSQRLLGLLDEFNRDTRRSQSASERRFTEARQAQLGAELRLAEDSAQRFLEANRSGIATSPQLKLIYDRLQRSVSLKQQVYANMVQAFEQARIEEVRDTPVITVVEAPRLPSRPVSRQLAVKGVMGTLVGLGLAVGWLLVGAGGRERREVA